jgi:hypothetical protein
VIRVALVPLQIAEHLVIALAVRFCGDMSKARGAKRQFQDRAIVKKAVAPPLERPVDFQTACHLIVKGHLIQ